MDIHKRHPKVQFFVPLGNQPWFQSCGITNVTELDWWQEVRLTLGASPGSKESSANRASSTTTTSESAQIARNEPSIITARITCLPAQHTTGRTLFGADKTLWASWSVKCDTPGPATSVYFAGDTGYRSVPDLVPGEDDYSEKHAKLPVCPAFAQIGELHGPFTLGLLPIGAYDPRYFMAPIHSSPRDSVEIFKNTRCRNAIAMHWGTWVMGDEDVLEPPRLLKEALAKSDLPVTGVFDAISIGESREYEGWFQCLGIFINGVT